MGYGMGQEDQRAKRKARLEARYGTPEAFEHPKPTDPLPLALPDTHRMPETAPKKKGGRPKGSKNKRAE